MFGWVVVRHWGCLLLRFWY